MMITTSAGWEENKIREWLLALLRLAITREHPDQTTAIALALELDSSVVRSGPRSSTFFQRTTCDVCEAILLSKAGQENQILRKHLTRIDDQRLRRAFQAAVGLPESVQEDQLKGLGEKSPELCNGLQSY